MNTLNNKWITKWKSKGLFNESLGVVSTSNNTLNSLANHYNEKVRLKFKGNILQEKTITYNHKNIINLYVVYEITNFQYNNNPILINSLFGAVKLTKNADIKKYKYSGYGIGFDSQMFYQHPSRRIGRDVIIFGVDMSSSTNTSNKEKYILILGKDAIEGLAEDSLSAEKCIQSMLLRVIQNFA